MEAAAPAGSVWAIAPALAALASVLADETIGELQHRARDLGVEDAVLTAAATEALTEIVGQRPNVESARTADSTFDLPGVD